MGGPRRCQFHALCVELTRTMSPGSTLYARRWSGGAWAVRESTSARLAAGADQGQRVNRPRRRPQRKVAAGPGTRSAATSLTCDLALVHRARQRCGGANVHRLNNVLALYCEAAGAVRPDLFLEAERWLRVFVATGKMGPRLGNR